MQGLVACAHSRVPKLRSSRTDVRLQTLRGTTSTPLVAMNGYPPPAGMPAPAWRAVKTADGREYYHNATTNATSWEKPDELKDEIEVRRKT